jgi:predicted TIM-barrel fold metal-dependent hydrolase
VVDCHHHWLPRELLEGLERYLLDGLRVERLAGHVRVVDQAAGELLGAHVEVDCDADLHRRLMDETGIDLALLSAGRAAFCLNLDGARLLNDASAELARASGGRFASMAYVPPVGEEGALAELGRAAGLGLRGVCIGVSFRGVYPDEAPFEPFLRRAAALDMPVFVHPGRDPWRPTPKDVPYPLESAGVLALHLQVLRLLRSDLLARVPALRLAIAHLGGSYFLGAGWRDRGLRWPGSEVADGPERVLFDTGPSFGYGPRELAVAVANLGARRLAIGSDFPIVAATDVLRDAPAHVRALQLPADEERAILGANAISFYSL